MTIAQQLLLPAFVYVAWVVLLGARVGRSRVRAAKAGLVNMKQVAIDSTKWPDNVRKVTSNFNNQFEVPMLYMLLLPLLLATQMADWVAVVLGWVFVASRIVHSSIQTGGNNVLHRFFVFLAGFILVAVMWAWFALRFYVIG